ncbi:MAG: hypothetical protein M1339_07320, partial [Bacteroidetes bacterium]|nr:hypothetical protein [Bacteroidota bacterium]
VWKQNHQAERWVDREIGGRKKETGERVSRRISAEGGCASGAGEREKWRKGLPSFCLLFPFSS